jgi:hypothetical protein
LWLVHLRFGEDEESWFEYDQLNLKPRRGLSCSRSGAVVFKIGRGTSGAHRHEICPEALRTAEISANSSEL